MQIILITLGLTFVLGGPAYCFCFILTVHLTGEPGWAVQCSDGELYKRRFVIPTALAFVGIVCFVIAFIIR